MKRFVLSCLAVFLLCSAPLTSQKPVAKHLTEPASPADVCAFIAGKMSISLSQVPTLCSGETLGENFYEIHVMTPSDALESKSRRAWASALFQTLEQAVVEPSLRGACAIKPICDIGVADTVMAERGLHYQVFLSADHVSLIQNQAKSFHGAELSDPWYLAWWGELLSRKDVDHPQSAENASTLGSRACDLYLQAVRRRMEMFQRTMPLCNVMLGTDKFLFVVLDFKDVFEAIMADNLDDFPNTFGKYLDDTGYLGGVIIRSPWSYSEKATTRVFREYPLRWIEFAYEEAHSGAREEVDASMLLLTRFPQNGQFYADVLQPNDSKDVELRMPAVVRTQPDGNSGMFIFTTDGAEWKVSTAAYASCSIGVGSEISVFFGPETKPSVTTNKDGQGCDLQAEFVKGW